MKIPSESTRALNPNPERDTAGSAAARSAAALLQEANIEAAIFDLDGTLIDSMPYWDTLARDYLQANGIQVPPDLEERIKPLTLLETAQWFCADLGLAGLPETHVIAIFQRIEGLYRETIPLKPGAADYLARLKTCGLHMAVATATAPDLADACLERLGVLPLFDFVLSCETVGVGKSQPDVFLLAASRLGSAPARTAVFEDAFYAARTARAAGFPTVGVHDDSAPGERAALQALCDAWISDFADAASELGDFCASRAKR